MDAEQEEKYGTIVDKWRNAVVRYGTGWDEDAPMIPINYLLNVDMVKYTLGGVFAFNDGAANGRKPPEDFIFANPVCDIMARVGKVKAHMNRMISSMEFAAHMLRSKEEDVSSVMFSAYMDEDEGGELPAGCTHVHAPRRVLDGGEIPAVDEYTRDGVPVVDAFAFVRLATELLKDRHHGSRFRTILRSQVTSRLKGHATGIPSSLPWDIGIGYELSRENDDPNSPRLSGTWLFELRMTAFTVCPFVLFETGGKQSHTQRSHVTVKLRTTAPVRPAAIMREMSTRLVPVMSNMKIPDETIQVLKSYAGPTFTEDAAVRMEKILRGVTAEFVPDGDVVSCQITVVSEDSHLAHDIVTTIESDLGANEGV